MEKKYLTPTEKEIDWLKNEVEKDRIELEKEKKRFIESIKGIKKEEIIKPEEELTLWKRIKKVLTGY